MAFEFWEFPGVVFQEPGCKFCQHAHPKKFNILWSRMDQLTFQTQEQAAGGHGKP